MRARHPALTPLGPAAADAIHGAVLSPPAPRRLPPLRQLYLKTLTVVFALLNSCRILAYLPTLLAIHETGDSSQHSVWTWCIWCGANLTTAAWLYEKDGHMSRVAAVSLSNAAMCAIAVAMILAYRL